MRRLERFRTRAFQLFERIRGQVRDDSVEGQARAFRTWAFASGLALILCAFGGGAGDSIKDLRSVAPTSADTVVDLIPEGLLLTPFAPVNFDSLNALVGQHAWVDLYLPSLSGGKGTVIAKSVALIRAPSDPSKFAVLLPEILATSLPSEQLFVAVRARPLKTKQTRREDAPNPKNPKEKHGQFRPLVRNFRPGIVLIQESADELDQTGDHIEN